MGLKEAASSQAALQRLHGPSAMAALLALLALLSYASAGKPTRPHNRVAIIEPCHSKRRRKDLTGGARAGDGIQCAVSGRKLQFEVHSTDPATHVLSFELNGVHIRDFPVATLPLSHSNGDGNGARRGDVRRLPLRIDNMMYGRNVVRIALHDDVQGHAILAHDQVAFLLIEPWGGRGARSCGDAHPEADDDSEATSSPQCVHAAALPTITVTAPRYVARAAVFTAAECDRIIASALMLGSDAAVVGEDDDAADNTNAAVADRDYRRTQRVFLAPERGRGHASRKGAGASAPLDQALDDLGWIYDRVRAFAGTMNRQHWQFALGGVPGSNATLLLENGTERRRRRRRQKRQKRRRRKQGKQQHEAHRDDSRTTTVESDANTRRTSTTGLGTDSNEYSTGHRAAVDEFACRPHELIQVLRYDGSDKGFYDWHMDQGLRDATALRKLSLTIQLSNASLYEGGGLEMRLGREVDYMPREQGSGVLFPSFILHRVAPVTRGVRYSMVVWFTGCRPFS